MKTLNTKIVLCLFALTTLASCQYDIDYSDSLPKDKLVLASFIEADSTISFKLYKSAPIGYYEDNDKSFSTLSKSFSQSMIKDATATLWVNGSKKETIQGNGSNKYSFAYRPQKNDNISIKVAHKDFDELSGSATISLTAPDIDTAYLYTAKKVDNEGDSYTSLVLYLRLHDDNQDNYYQLSTNILVNGTQLLLKNTTVDWENYQNVFTPTVSNLFSSGASNHYGVFSNHSFKGKTYILKLTLAKAYTFNASEESFNYFADIKGNIYLSKIDKGAYNYLYSLNQYLNSSKISSEPVIIANSLINGYGFIGSKATTKIFSTQAK